MILIIDKTKRERESIQDMFYYMGIPSRGVAPEEAARELSPLYRAVILTSPDTITALRELVDELREICNIPIYALSSHSIDYVDGVFPSNIYSSELVKEISKKEVECGREPLGVYRLAGIDASLDLRCPTVFGKEIGLTKTETMILRVLIKAYPIPALPKEILKYAFRQARMPEMPSVRTHISVINKKFSGLFGRQLTMPGTPGGYVISTPELRAKEKESAI